MDAAQEALFQFDEKANRWRKRRTRRIPALLRYVLHSIKRFPILREALV
jgi:hypothetical protein